MTISASSPTETSTKTIRVVDDDAEVLSVAEDMLRCMRYSVIGTWTRT
jgi:FixJ family two-component response regulator